MAELYRIQGLAQRYGARQVLDIPDFAVEQGEVLALVGPSGAGKSTLLRLLNFLEPPTAGSIAYRGHSFAAGKEMPLALRRQVTTVFQRPMLLSGTVWENVAYGLRLRGQRAIQGEVERALQQVGLAGMSQAQARTLSGGEAQRVALARALALHPTALLLDEPTANLDPYNVGLIEEVVLHLNRAQGVTLVLVTHNVFQARRLAQRAALLLEGRLVEAAGSDIFFNQPADPRTAAFVRGEMVY